MNLFAHAKIFAAATIAATALVVGLLPQQAHAERIRDICRLRSNVPNELVAMGLVVGLNGTGDGGKFLPAMRPLAQLMKNFDNPVQMQDELKDATNVAIVSLSVEVPETGVVEGTRLDVRVSSIAAKSLKGGRLHIIPMIAPSTRNRTIFAFASGDLVIDDEKSPTVATIKGGAKMTSAILPEEVKENFDLAIKPNNATEETASAIAARINEEISPQTGGNNVAVAVDATTVHVMVPLAERRNVTDFIGRIREIRMPTLSGPAKILVNRSANTMVFSDEVEVAPCDISSNGVSVRIDGQPASDAAKAAGAATVQPTLQDLENALTLMKVSPAQRITIVEMLHTNNSIKAELEYSH